MSNYSILHDINNQPISATNPLPITGSFGFSGGVTITSSIDTTIIGSTITQSVTVTNPTTQVTASVSSLPAITGTVTVDNPVTQVTASISNPVTQLTASVSNFPATQTTERKTYNTSALSSVTASTAATNILASDANRVKFMLSHTGSATAFVALGATATTSSFTVYMTNGDYFEQEGFYGNVSVIFGSASSTTYLYATSITK